MEIGVSEKIISSTYTGLDLRNSSSTPKFTKDNPANSIAAAVQDKVVLSGKNSERSPSSLTTEENEKTTVINNNSDCEDCEEELTQEEQKIVEQLKARDREVKAHERAHQAAAGGLARGGPSYTYTTGPDGKRYAVGGEVQIDTSPVPDNPEATIRKAQTIRRAATAPAEPSAQDRSVAAAASKMEAQARQELAQEKIEKTSEKEESSPALDFNSKPSKVSEERSNNNSENISEVNSVRGGPPSNREKIIQNFSQPNTGKEIGSLLNAVA